MIAGWGVSLLSICGGGAPLARGHPASPGFVGLAKVGFAAKEFELLGGAFYLNIV